MRVLGIDLAAQPASTGAVLLAADRDGRWRATVAAVEPDDDELVALGTSADMVGVDAPLGWPEPFVAAVTAHAAHREWPGTDDRRPLTHRRTDDVVVAQGWGRPMSASADRLGSVAMRAALLQRRWAGSWGAASTARDGSARLAETYPAAALRVWDVAARGYKASGARAAAARDVRATVVAELSARTARWCDLDGCAAAAVDSDHVLDALLCALVALAVTRGATLRPRDADEARLALVEGWIHVPTVVLEDLAPG